ncbi:hypothetical protein ZOSMA_4G01620 [Zostera marina]|uniref:Uncharacterized protein n=1 Tax=Zostera marina TaxID=29655 RepID=A0A0K9NYS1_ZOSMR|nr:hypothetical protein ZOSMA_4G01620 [Zostera marina]
MSMLNMSMKLLLFIVIVVLVSEIKAIDSGKAVEPNGDCYIEADPISYPWLFRPPKCLGDARCSAHCVQDKGYKLGGLCRWKTVILFEKALTC